MIQCELPANFATIYEACFSEPADLSELGPSARMIRTDVSWLVYEAAGKTAWIKWAAVIPAARNAQHGSQGFREALASLRSKFDDIRLWTRCENVIPQILALKNGFIVDGIRVGRSGKLQILWRTK